MSQTVGTEGDRSRETPKAKQSDRPAFRPNIVDRAWRGWGVKGSLRRPKPGRP